MRHRLWMILILHSLFGCDTESSKIGSEHQMTGAGDSTQSAQATPANIVRERVVQQIRCDFHLDQADDLHKIETILSVRLAPRKAVASRKDVEDLIDRFAEIDSLDFTSSTLYGGFFIAIQSHQLPEAFVLPGSSNDIFPALVKAVCLGPDALPVLLDFLNDKRPTKLTYMHPNIFGSMSIETKSLPANPINTREAYLAQGLRDMGEDEGKVCLEYTVTVGDICFVAIGQITGRNYNCVHHISSGLVGINSPVMNDSLCESVRKIWTSDDFSSDLHNSLVLDFHTRSIFDGNDGKSSNLCWMAASRLQVEAVQRLLFYYPDTGLKLARRRLQSLSSSSDDTPEQHIAQKVDSGVSVGEFVRAVSWCLDDEIQTELKRLRR